MQRIREQLLGVLVDNVCAGPNFSRIGARVGGGGPCSRDGAPTSTAFLNLGSACLRRINGRVLCNAMDNLFSLQVILFAATFDTESSHFHPPDHAV